MHFHKHNSPIFQKDSDFEVFVDPFGSNHHYKELEVNAINTVWNLMLNKPYDDGGEEYSGRIAKPGDEKYFEVYRQKTATKIVRGRRIPNSIKPIKYSAYFTGIGLDSTKRILFNEITERK